MFGEGGGYRLGDHAPSEGKARREQRWGGEVEEVVVVVENESRIGEQAATLQRRSWCRERLKLVPEEDGPQAIEVEPQPIALDGRNGRRAFGRRLHRRVRRCSVE